MNTAKSYDPSNVSKSILVTMAPIQVVPPKPIIEQSAQPTSWLGSHYATIH